MFQYYNFVIIYNFRVILFLKKIDKETRSTFFFKVRVKPKHIYVLSMLLAAIIAEMVNFISLSHYILDKFFNKKKKKNSLFILFIYYEYSIKDFVNF